VTTQVYEEIKGIDPNIVVPEPNPGTSSLAASNYVEYEDVNAARGVDKSEENYRFTCVQHYGVPLETNH
jgi:hypothetical protein